MRYFGTESSSFQGCRNHGCSGCKCTRCLLHFQLCGCSAGAVRVQCGCRLGVQPVHKTFTTDRIKHRSRMCVGVFHPAVVRNSAKLLSIWRKVKRKALLMEFLARNYGGIVPKYMGVPDGGTAGAPAPPPSLLGKQSQSGNIRSTVGQYWLIIKKWDKFCQFCGGGEVVKINYLRKIFLALVGQNPSLVPFCYGVCPFVN